MNRIHIIVGLATLGASLAPDASVQAQQPQQNRMTFFVTSEGLGSGGNLGGIDGADRHCQALAAAVGAGDRTWHAYLSTQATGNQPAVNAGDRIGPGPWYNSKGQRIGRDVDDLHGYNNNVSKQTALTEAGESINDVLDPPPNQHNILTGSRFDGMAFPPEVDKTCSNWTNGGDTGSAQGGHHDRTGVYTSWNSAHPSKSCSQEALVADGGYGAFYCFAID